MYYEYAVDPDSLAGNWKDTRNLLEKFGFDQGRLISRFPGKWTKKAYNCLRIQELRDVERKVLETALEQIKNQGIIPSNRTYNSDSNWLTNAVQQHNKLPFHAIIELTGKQESDYIVHVEDVSNNHPLFNVQKMRYVPRVAAEFVKAVDLLLRTQKKYMFVDPFFDISKERYRNSLKMFLKSIHELGNPESEIQIHFDLEKDEVSKLAHQKQTAKQYSHEYIPDGMTIILYPWTDTVEGELFHARFLLTEKAGVIFEAGFSSRDSKKTIPLILMDQEMYLKAVQNFDIYENYGPHEFIGPRIKVHSNGNIEELD